MGRGVAIGPGASQVNRSRAATHHQESESTMSWDFLWTTFTVYVLAAFLFLLFIVLRDLFRSDSSGTVKSLWVVALVFLPILSTIAYLVIRGVSGDDGSGVANRMAQAQQRSSDFSTIGR